MSNTLDDKLYCAAKETFESLAFMLTSPELDADNGLGPVSPVAVGVSFTGPFAGRLFVRIDRLMLDELAANMLGLMDDQEGPSREQQEDALKELTNVVCGNLLPEIAGDQAEFDVRAPEIVGVTMPRSVDDQPAAACAELRLDSGKVEVALFARSVRPAETAGTPTAS